MSRTIFSVTLAAILMVALTSTAKADTYISYWKNETACTYTIENNGRAAVALDGHKSYDFGAFPRKDPRDLKMNSSLGSHCAPPARIDYEGHFPGKTCGGKDPGPFKFTITSGKHVQDFCYCINWGRVGYLNVRVTSAGANLEIGPNAYGCGNPY